MRGIVAIEQERADAVLSHGADTVAEDQPAGIGLDGGSAVPKLDQFPGERRFEEHLALIPEVDVVGKHQVDVLVVLAGEHGIEAVDLPGEQGHAFVLGGRTVQGDEPKEEEVGGLHQFRHDHLAIEGGEGGVVDVGAVIVLEADEAGVFDAVALRRRGREEDALGQLLFGLELNFVVGPGQHPNPLRRVLIFLRHSIRQAELFGLAELARSSSSANDSPSLFITRRVNSLVNPSSESFRPNSAFSYTGFGI